MVIDRHTLDDLYVRGKKFELPNPRDPAEPIKLFMRKLGPVFQQKAVKHANAARIVERKVLERDDDDVEKMSVIAGLYELGGLEDWIEYLCDLYEGTVRPKVEQEISQKDEWAQDDYLQSLVDAWDEDMQADFDKPEEKRLEETNVVWSALQEFNEQVNEAVAKKRAVHEKEIRDLEDEEIADRVKESFVERNASLAWLRTYRDHQILYGLENMDGDRIYDDIEQVQNMELAMYRVFLDAIEELNMGVTELK